MANRVSPASFTPQITPAGLAGVVSFDLGESHDHRADMGRRGGSSYRSDWWRCRRTAPDANHPTSKIAVLTAIAASCGVSCRVGDCDPWRDVCPCHNSFMFAINGAMSPVPSGPGIANENSPG